LVLIDLQAGGEIFMKRFILVLASIFVFSWAFFPLPKAHAQYYSSSYSYGYYPSFLPYGFGYGCLRGCGNAYRAASIIYLTTDAIDYGLYLNESTKAVDAQINQTKYQAAANRSFQGNPQAVRDYYNMQLVAPFFADDVPHYTPQSKIKNPEVAPLEKKSSEKGKTE
jgi:hypothetical protein